MNEPLKNMYSRAYLDDLAAALERAHPPFESEAFIAGIIDEQWEDRALKERMRHITLAMHEALPQAYPMALDILRRTAPDLSDYGFQNMVFSDFVELYGLDEWELSLPALEQFTRLVSAEFAVRPFIVKDQDRMLARMLLWAKDEDDQLRRLATEGCRPRLPWGIALPALKADPSPILPILEQLRNDPSESVRRSVANNLNDVSKDNPDVVIEVLRRWQKEDSPEMAWIISHALRTLVKQGDPEALDLLGYPANPAVEVKNLMLEPANVPMGGKLTILFEIESLAQTDQKLMVDYVVHLMRANGRLTPKVFKLRKITLAPGETIRIVKNHSFAPVTTRKYYPGQQAIEIQVNGRLSEREGFELV